MSGPGGDCFTSLPAAFPVAIERTFCGRIFTGRCTGVQGADVTPDMQSVRAVAWSLIDESTCAEFFSVRLCQFGSIDSVSLS